jgi:HK97 family phage major capsid protein
MKEECVMSTSIQALRNEHEAAKTAARDLFVRIKQQTENGSRLMTVAERAELQAAIDRTQALERRVANAGSDDALQMALERATGGMMATGYGGHSIGAQHGQALERWLKENPHRGSRWEGPITEHLLPGFGGVMATTITSDPTTGGMLVPPQYLPGIVPVPLRPPVVADLLGSGPTNSNAITYMKETAYTVAAAAVAEGAAKPESAIALVPVTDPVVKLAHWIPITDELLEDVPAMSAYIDTRLSQGLLVVEDDQLLNGNGTAPNMMGLLNRAGLAPPVARGTDTNADAVAKQIAAIRTSTNRVASGVVLHPTNWESMLLAKDSTGRYIGLGPGAPPAIPSLWGLPVAVSTAMAVGTALVVSGTAAMVFRRGGINVQTSNSHQDFFVRNMVAIRSEERLALCVFRPAAFGTVTGLN